MFNPNDLKYSKSDEWVKVDGNAATIGVTDYAQSQLSDIVFLEFKVEPGDILEKDSGIVTIESVKAAADVNTPISGKVIDLNHTLEDGYEAINSDPYQTGWMVKLELSDPSELNSLMDKPAYEKYCEERSQ